MTSSQVDADALLARQLQHEEEAEERRRKAASAGAAAAAATSSRAQPAAAAAPTASERHASLRRLVNDDCQGIDGGSGGVGRRVNLGLDPSLGDEAAFFLNRVCGAHNRCALSMGVILGGDVQRCILVNYCIDAEWLFDSFPQLLTYPRVDIVHGGNRDDNRQRGAGGGGAGGHHKPVQQEGASNVWWYQAAMPVSYGVHHSKMIICVYAHGIRVAVCTANFISVDWIWKNNVTFVQDFPRKSAASPRSSPFEDDLLDYLDSYRARSGLDISELRQFDFSTAKAQIIPSVPGWHKGPQLHRYGHMRLRAILAREPLPRKFDNAPICAQFSSVGNVSEQWLMEELRTSMAAHAPEAVPNGSGGGAAASSNAPSALMSSARALPPLKLVWPTVQQVRESLEGYVSGTSLCCDTKNMKPFMRPLLHVWDGVAAGRDRAMPHIKSYCRAAPDGELAWVLLTSANCSNAAWGQLQKSGTQLQIRSYEIGVLFTPSYYAQALATIKARRLESFSCTPHNPLIFTPKGDMADTTYFRQQQQREAPSVPPIVRLMLLPPLGTFPAPAAAAASSSLVSQNSNSAAAQRALSAKRKLEATDLTGDDDDEEESEGPSGFIDAAAAAGSTATASSKRARQEFTPTPASVAASTELISPTPPSSAAAAPASAPLVHTVLCPIPWNVNARRYTAADEPWTWDQARHTPDCRGLTFPGIR